METRLNCIFPVLYLTSLKYLTASRTKKNNEIKKVFTKNYPLEGGCILLKCFILFSNTRFASHLRSISQIHHTIQLLLQKQTDSKSDMEKAEGNILMD